MQVNQQPVTQPSTVHDATNQWFDNVTNNPTNTTHTTRTGMQQTNNTAKQCTAT